MKPIYPLSWSTGKALHVLAACHLLDLTPTPSPCTTLLLLLVRVRLFAVAQPECPVLPLLDVLFNRALKPLRLELPGVCCISSCD